jgi:hypothetical protein
MATSLVTTGAKASPLVHRPLRAGRPLSIADVSDVVAWGWDGEQLLEELISIDYRTMEDLTLDHEGQAKQWAPVFMDHPETWRLLISGPREIVGYWHFVPLFESSYQRARAGQLLDSEITADTVRLFELSGCYDIYWVSICLLPQFRRPHALRMLFASMSDVIRALAEEGIFIREVCTNAYTRSGVSLCLSLGFQHLAEHEDRGRVFVGHADLLFDSQIGRDQDLLELYRNSGCE